MPSFDHVFRCTACRSRVEFQSHSSDPDNPPLPSLIHSELDEFVQKALPAARRRIASRCMGRARWESSRATAIQAGPPPVVLTVLQHSNVFAANTAGGNVVNTVCAALDVTNNRVKKGVNQHGLGRLQLAWELQNRLNNVHALEAWSTVNCAEIQAVNKLLLDGSRPQDIRVHSRFLNTNPKPPCENCQGWLTAVGDGSYKLR